jgi:hypothetical protein
MGAGWQQAPDVPQNARRIAGSATLADILQPRIHQGVFGADRIDVFSAVEFRYRSSCRHRARRSSGSRFLRRRRRRSDPVVTGQPGAGIGYRFAIRRLGGRGLGKCANPRRERQQVSFQPLFGRRNQAITCRRSARKRFAYSKIKDLTKAFEACILRDSGACTRYKANNGPGRSAHPASRRRQVSTKTCAPVTMSASPVFSFQ